jgi:hypothetical protein
VIDTSTDFASELMNAIFVGTLEVCLIWITFVWSPLKIGLYRSPLPERSSTRGDWISPVPILVGVVFPDEVIVVVLGHMRSDKVQDESAKIQTSIAIVGFIMRV